MAFSVMTNIKTKQRFRLSNIEIAMRPALTDIKPRFNLLCQNKQARSSHYISLINLVKLMFKHTQRIFLQRCTKEKLLIFIDTKSAINQNYEMQLYKIN